jgi:hypothetical protein
MWLRHQPNSALSQWFHQRTEGQSKRMRCVMIVALARKRNVSTSLTRAHIFLAKGCSFGGGL